MPDQVEVPQDVQADEPLKKVLPTLFIAVGGTGMEIALRVRRRILNNVWGSRNNPLRIASLAEFPLAQFINFDLDASSKTESEKSSDTDPLANLVKFNDEEKLILKLDMDKYIRTDGELNKYPHIASWFPLTRKKALELNITRPEGAGQIRSLSRLYFFDKYPLLRPMIEGKIDALISGVSNKNKTDRLGLELQDSSLRVVVIASSAGGTGSGSFLDMGYLAKGLANKRIKGAKVDLCFMLPSGYSGLAGSRTEANTYGALMELETCFSQEFQFVQGWRKFREVEEFIPTKPYDDVFLFDTINLAMKKTAKKEDVFDMVADILFEDFTSEKFADRKRSIAPNQYAVHKTDNLFLPVDSKKYGSMTLRYSKAYSAFGQSIIDTQLDQRRDEIACNQVNDMLKVFFGIASDTGGGREVPPPTPDDGRNLLKEEPVYCNKEIFKIAYQFVSDGAPYQEGLEFAMPKLVDHLLVDGGQPMIGHIHDRINNGIDEILASTEKDQRLLRVEKLRTELDRDLGIEGGATDAGARGLEESIKARRKFVFQGIVDGNSALLKALWAAVNNKEKGGLDYTIQLIERIKDCIENDVTGLLRDFDTARKWFSGLCEKLRIGELQVIRGHINQAKGGGFFSFAGNKESHAEAKLQQMGEAIRWYAEARLREVACKEAEILLKDLSAWLGQHQGIDERTNRKRWSAESFAGKLAGYEKLVVEIMASMKEEVVRTREATKQGHAAYQIVKASTAELDAARNLDPVRALEWANKAFENLGGSREIFTKLENEISRAELIGKLRGLALSQLPATRSGTENPLFKALVDMPDPERRKLFQHCMDMAMPWVEANLEGVWDVSPSQYSCIIGVDEPEIWKTGIFGDEIRNSIPARTHMTPRQIQFESGVPGKLTCYVELSGLPLPALNMLSNWRENYNIESKKIPVHTHKDKTLFVHPIAPSAGALDSLADHFRLYIQGIVLGVLKLRLEDPDERVYCIAVQGEELSIGNERTIRLDGIAPEHLVYLQQKITDSLGRFKTPTQYAALVVLFEYYSQCVYPPAKIKSENLGEFLSYGFSNVMCSKLREEARKVLTKKSDSSDTDLNDLLSSLKGTVNLGRWEDFKALGIWAVEIEGSETDVYENEVSSLHRAKRILKPEFFQAGWLEKQFKGGGDEPSNVCSTCGGKIDGNPKFCPHCGNERNIGNKCTSCYCVIVGNPKFCPECGAKQGGGLRCGNCGCSIEGSPKFCPECGKAM